MKKTLIGVAELEARAMNTLRNYEGQRMTANPYEQGRNFQGVQARPIAPTPTSFTLTVTNTGSSAEDRTIALLPAYFTDKSQVKDSAGAAVAGILCEGLVCGTVVGNNNVQAVGKPKSIDEFLAFIKQNPLRITGLKMKVDNTDQFSEDLLFRKESPFKDLGFVTKSPSNYENSMANNDKIVEIPLTDAQFDNQTSVVTTIKAGRTVTFTFFVGAISNQAAMLDQTVKSAGI
jgi:hypothetical protein